MKNTCLFIFLLFSCLLFTIPVNANYPNYFFSKINSENGLSQNTVKSILQDSWGFVWFGTGNRLNRFDGKSIKVFDCIDPKTNHSNNNISTIFEDSEKKLWIGTDKGIYIFNPIDETFSFFALKTPNGIQINDWVSDIKSDSENNIWIVIPNQGLFQYRANAKKLYHFGIGKNKLPDQGNPECMCIARNGKLWVGTNGAGVYLYNRAANNFTQYLGNTNGNTLVGKNIYTMCDYGDELVVGIHEGKLMKFNKRKNSLTDVNAPEVHYKIIRDVVCLNDKQLWVGTQSGLFIIDEMKQSVVHVHEELANPHSLSDNVVEKIFQDKEGGVWIGTYFGGVNYLPNQGMNFEKYIPTLEKGTISSKRVSELKEDAAGNIWVGTEDAGLNILNPKTKKITQIGKDLGRPVFNKKILSIFLKDNNAWIGFFKNGLDIVHLPGFSNTHFSGTDLGLNEASVDAICEDRLGRMWIGNGWGVFMSEGKSMKFKPIHEFGYSYIYDLMEDSEGNIWAATMGNGVFKHNPYNHTTRHYVNRIDDKSSLSSNSVSSITETTSGEIWFATDRGGICRYNKNKNNFTSFSIEDGLPDDVAYKILEDKNRNLWFGTNKGLVRFNPGTKDIRVYTQNDGLLGNQFNYKSALSTKSGKFYFGGFDGLIAFDPYQIKENTYLPPVYITKMTIFDKEPVIGGKRSPLEKSIIHSSKITLRYDQSNIGFEFAALSYTAPLSNKYAYKMDNIDKDWNYTSNSHSVSYAKLPPGEYTFRVKGTNNDGLWNENGTTLKIEILPPWWLSKLAYLIYLIIIIYSVKYILRRLKTRHEKRNLEKQQLFETEKEKELYSAKVEFFTNIAHEIRTPLTLINGPLESLKEMNINDNEIKKNLHIMEDNTKHLLSLINQLLDFRKIDNNKFLLSFTITDINEMLQETKDRFEVLANKQNKKISLTLPHKKIEAPVDKDGLTKILNNLLVNAVKYSDEFIKIELSIENEYFVICISNDGSLIPVEESEKIFDPFYQLTKNRNASSSTGIGLSLARSLAELHNGMLLLDTEADTNSFILKLPLIQEKSLCVPETTDEMNAFIVEETDLVNEKNNLPALLIVEDNVEMLSFIVEKLNSKFVVEKALNGIEALKILEEKTIDIILSDIMMPEMDGYEFCKIVKGNIEYSHIPVVLLTAKNDLESKIQGLSVGADAYIEKPFSFNHLLTQLTTLLNNRMREREAFMQKPFLPIQQIGMCKADEVFMEKMIEIINENITDGNFNVEKLSEIAFISRSSLHRKIKALSGLSPTDFIRLIRLKKAAELIQEGRYRIGEICYLVGINSSSYFIKLFQKQFGMTPKEFYKQSSGKE
ncbi:MAG: two-component regulator propeller domain-containing protein [Bacteroidota bacterium]|nr:two-component regulator propeller domain-containing protein [Bacteroidota bacterium]